MYQADMNLLDSHKWRAAIQEEYQTMITANIRVMDINHLPST
jgi:hypothetical protein